MSTCPCTCHTGPYAPCSVSGGCGHLHTTDRPMTRRDANRLLGGDRAAPATATEPDPARPIATPASAVERPHGACLTHRPPKPDRPWRRADDGYRTCGDCCDRLHRWLSLHGVDADGRPDSIPTLYTMLNPTPSNHGPGRRAPGFGSRSPGSDHVIALRDPRTRQYDTGDPSSAAAQLRAWVTYVWDERYDNDALNEPDYQRRRRELPVTVIDAAMWLDRQLDWITRHDIVIEFDVELRELVRQLRTATGGGGQRPVGHCIEILATGECQAPIYMPRGELPRAPDEPIAGLPELTCQACGSTYTGRRLIVLRLAEEKAAAGAGRPAA